MNQVRELEVFAGQLAERLEVEFSLPVSMFEHGATAAMQDVGCGVDHAHLHLVPLEFDLIDAARSADLGLSILSHAGGYQELPSTVGGASYVFIRSHDGSEAVLLGTEGESQLIRRVIAKKVALPDRWNWRDHPRPDLAEATAQRLMAEA